MQNACLVYIRGMDGPGGSVIIFFNVPLIPYIMFVLLNYFTLEFKI